MSKLLTNFAVPIPKEESEIKALYEGIKGLGYRMFTTDWRSYVNSYYSYLRREVNSVSGNNYIVKSCTVYPSFEAFKEAHDKFNGIVPKQEVSITKDLHDLQEFLNRYFDGDFQEFIEYLYGGYYCNSVAYIDFQYGLGGKCIKTNHDPQGDNYTLVGTIKDTMTEDVWEFTILDGNGNGTEVQYFEKTEWVEGKIKVDKEETMEDNTLARVSSGGGGSYIYNPESKELITKYEKAYTLNIEDLPKHANKLNKTEEKTMRRVVTVKLINPNPAIEASDSLVANFGEYVTDDSNDILIQEIIMEGDVQDKLDEHNRYLTETVDLSILKATGQRVMMQPVRLKDLKWIIKE